MLIGRYHHDWCLTDSVQIKMARYWPEETDDNGTLVFNSGSAVFSIELMATKTKLDSTYRKFLLSRRLSDGVWLFGVVTGCVYRPPSPASTSFRYHITHLAGVRQHAVCCCWSIVCLIFLAVSLCRISCRFHYVAFLPS